MEFKKNKIADGTEIAVTGRIDTVTAPDLQAALLPEFAESEKVILNLAGVNYISSAGLRVLLAAQKEAKKRGKSFVLTNVLAEVSDIFEMTGFSGILTIE
jgi:anti-sigma B factor antagonist